MVKLTLIFNCFCCTSCSGCSVLVGICFRFWLSLNDLKKERRGCSSPETSETTVPGLDAIELDVKELDCTELAEDVNVDDNERKNLRNPNSYNVPQQVCYCKNS